MKATKIFASALSLILLAGCASAGETVKFESKNNMPDYLNIYTKFSFLDSYGTMDQAAMDSWNAYMTEKYQSAITVSSIPMLRELTKLNVDFSKSDGVVQLAAGEINHGIAGDSILPLEDYLKDNQVWQRLPDEFKNRFMKDGHLWAIPYSSGYNVEVLSLNTEWLKKTGQNMPSTLEELVAAGKVFVEKDANGDGKKNDFLFGIPNMMSHDVFASFGLYFSRANQQVAYNPLKKRFEDPVKQDRIKDVLEYIRALNDQGIVDVNSIIATADVLEKNALGAYGVIQGSPAAGKFQATFKAKAAGGMTQEEMLKNYDAITAGFEALPPLSGDNPLTYSADGRCYVLSKSTKDPKRVVNAFVDILFSSVKTNLDMTVGNSDHYKLSGTTATMKYADENNKTAYTKANLTDTLDLVGNGEYIVLNPGDNEELARKIKTDSKKYITDYLDRNKESGKMVEISPFLLADSPAISGYGMLNIQFSNMMSGLASRRNTVENLLNVYDDSTNSLEFYEERIKILNEVNHLAPAEN